MRNVFAFLLLALVLHTAVAQAASEGTSPPLDLNRATADQLESLPGIGAAKATAILAERDLRGGFESIEELESVRGIGSAMVEKLRPLVVLGPKSAKAAKPTRK